MTAITGVVLGFTKHRKVVRVSHHGPWSTNLSRGPSGDAKRVLQAMQRHIRQQRPNHRPLRCPGWGLLKDAAMGAPHDCERT